MLYRTKRGDPKRPVYNLHLSYLQEYNFFRAKSCGKQDEEQTSQTANQYMPARKHSLTLRGEWDHQFGKHFGLNVSLSGRALSSVSNEEYYDLSTPERGTHEVIYPAYSLWKMQVAGRINNWMKLTLTVDNIFNYRPEYYYYNAPLTQGINLVGGASFDVDKLF